MRARDANVAFYVEVATPSSSYDQAKTPDTSEAVKEHAKRYDPHLL